MVDTGTVVHSADCVLPVSDQRQDTTPAQPALSHPIHVNYMRVLCDT